MVFDMYLIKEIINFNMVGVLLCPLNRKLLANINAYQRKNLLLDFKC